MDHNPFVWDAFPLIAWVSLLAGPVVFTVIYRAVTRFARSRLDPLECLADGLHQPGSLVLIVGAVSVGAATHYSRTLGWIAPIVVVVGALLAAAYSIGLLRYGLPEFRRKEWVMEQGGSLRTIGGAAITAKYADIHFYWGPTLVVWATGLVQVTDADGRAWTNRYPNSRAAQMAFDRLSAATGLPRSPGPEGNDG